MDDEEFKSRIESDPYMKMIMDTNQRAADNNATIVAMIYRLFLSAGLQTPESLFEHAEAVCSFHDEPENLSVYSIAKIWRDKGQPAPKLRLVKSEVSE